MFRSFGVLTLFIASAQLFALDVVNRHNEGGNVGANGIKQHVLIKISKVVTTGKDSAFIQVDLGDHKYASNKPIEWTDPDLDPVATGTAYKPVIILTLGSAAPLTATSDAKGKLSGDFSGKLMANGAALQVKLKKATLQALLSELSGVGEHAMLTVKFENNHPPSTTPVSAGVEPRHAHEFFEAIFTLDIKENAKSLQGKG